MYSLLRARPFSVYSNSRSRCPLSLLHFRRRTKGQFGPFSPSRLHPSLALLSRRSPAALPERELYLTDSLPRPGALIVNLLHIFCLGHVFIILPSSFSLVLPAQIRTIMNSIHAPLFIFPLSETAERTKVSFCIRFHAQYHCIWPLMGPSYNSIRTSSSNSVWNPFTVRFILLSRQFR